MLLVFINQFTYQSILHMETFATPLFVKLVPLLLPCGGRHNGNGICGEQICWDHSAGTGLLVQSNTMEMLWAKSALLMSIPTRRRFCFLWSWALYTCVTPPWFVHLHCEGQWEWVWPSMVIKLSRIWSVYCLGFDLSLHRAMAQGRYPLVCWIPPYF